MKTIRQVLADEVLYPLPDGFIDNKLLIRGLDAETEATSEVCMTNSFQGALADCLLAIVEQAVNFSEADKSIGVPTATQINALKTRINKIYVAIGEEEQIFDNPKVTFGVGW